MHKRPIYAVASALAAMGLAMSPLAAHASSHREAPLIAQDPLADNTDVYLFQSPDRPANVVIVANYIPFENAAGGPNFYKFGDDVLYQMHVDNVGDGKSHLTFSFKFHTSKPAQPGTFLYVLPGGAQNQPQTYDIDVMNADTGVDTVLGTGLSVPADFQGPKSQPNYRATAVAPAIHDLGTNGVGPEVFAGQRDDPFYANLGPIFDLINIANPTSPTGGEDYVRNFNVHSIVLSVPRSMVQGPNDSIIGVWASASRKTTTVLEGDGTKQASGPWVQVSRLGNPLVNEVVIGLGQKDLFNATAPAQDSQFTTRFANPILATYLNVLFGEGVSDTGRQDLVDILLRGVGPLNRPVKSSADADELRFNMDAPTFGFPNGRNLTENVVDTELNAVDGFFCGKFGLAPCTPGAHAGNLHQGVGADADHPTVSNAFPYLNDPNGY